MKIEISIAEQKARFEAQDAADLLRQVKAEATKRAPFLMRPAVQMMSEMSFAARVVSRANRETGESDQAPQNAEQFLSWAVRRGYATFLSD